MSESFHRYSAVDVNDAPVFGTETMSDAARRTWDDQFTVTSYDRFLASLEYTPDMSDAERKEIVQKKVSERAFQWYKTHIGGA